MLENEKKAASFWKREKIYVLDWQTFGSCLEKMRYQLINSDFHPTAVIGIARGGLIAATYMANVFDIKEFHALGIARNVNNAKYSTKQEPELLWISTTTSLEGQSVLLVDDIVGEGRTLSFAVDLLKQKGAAHIQTAVIVDQAKSTFKADYSVITLDDWIIFPWEKVTPGKEGIYEAVKI